MNPISRKSRHVRIRLHADAPEQAWHREHLRQELLSGGGPPATAMVAVEPFAPYEPLVQVPALLPTGEWLEQAISALRQDDVGGVDRAARRLVAFDPQDLRSETRVAWFLLGLLAQRAGEVVAAEHYRRAIADLSPVRALARSNLAVVLAIQIGDPGAADVQLLQAVSEPDACLPALVNRARLARGLARVGYPAPVEGGAWQELEAQAERRVREVAPVQLAQWLASDTFPNHRCVALLPVGYPPAGLGLVDPETGRGAAELLLHQAQDHLQRGDAAQALCLAVAAAAKSAATRPAAVAVKARAERELAAQAELERAGMAVELVAAAAKASAAGDHPAARNSVAVLSEFAPAAQGPLGEFVEGQAAATAGRQALAGGAAGWGAAGVAGVGQQTVAASMLQEVEALLGRGELRLARERLEAVAGLDAAAAERVRPRLEATEAEWVACRVADLRVLAATDVEAAAKGLAEVREQVGPVPEVFAFAGWVAARRHRLAGQAAVGRGDLEVAVQEFGAAGELLVAGGREWGEVMILLLEVEVRRAAVADVHRREWLRRAAATIRGGGREVMEQLLVALQGAVADSRFVRLVRAWLGLPPERPCAERPTKRSHWLAIWRRRGANRRDV